MNLKGPILIPKLSRQTYWKLSPRFNGPLIYLSPSPISQLLSSLNKLPPVAIPIVLRRSGIGSGAAEAFDPYSAMGVHFQLCTMTTTTGTQSKFNHRIITISLAKKFHSNSSAKREARIETGSPTTILTIVLIKILRILRIFLHPLFRRLISFSCILIFIFTTRYCPAVFSPLLSNSSTTISITQSTSTWEKIREQRRDLRICRMGCVAYLMSI
ncbi:uncharacterized protein LOC111808375 [Cucurbita pepo subsp. pepo]|uniref:uncharacterized protein LOC111808375 n=1 Tax=Cucurbita pepo subsp. pepo TaxID=3664 RepID=UPI000C9D62B6|nr:uncharacterized protein LOC111808375 [Cucurbita pepo subsp. pepo]